MYERLGDILPSALNRLRVKKPVDAARVCEAVSEVLGEQWDHAVPMRAVTYRGGIVTVAVTSSGWSHEVSITGDEIIKKANQKLGDGAIRTLKTRVSPNAARGD
jgi:hypothetical protein